LLDRDDRRGLGDQLDYARLGFDAAGLDEFESGEIRRRTADHAPHVRVDAARLQPRLDLAARRRQPELVHGVLAEGRATLDHESTDAEVTNDHIFFGREIPAGDLAVDRDAWMFATFAGGCHSVASTGINISLDRDGAWCSVLCRWCCVRTQHSA